MAREVRDIGERLPSDTNDVEPADPLNGLSEVDYVPRTFGQREELTNAGASGGGGDTTVKNSIEKDGGDLQFVNDEEEPAEWHVYGTNASKERGWIDFTQALFHQSNGDLTDIDGNVVYEAISLFICRSGEAVERTFLVKKEEE